MSELNKQIRSLQEVHGTEKLLAAATEILGKKVPTDYVRVLDPLELQASLQQIDAAIRDVIEKGIEQESAYGKKADLIKQKVKLKTAVELKEAEAFMQIHGEGRNQFAYVNGQKVALTNDTLRDAYRLHYSKEERQQLTEVEQELASIDIKIYQKRDAWGTAKESADLVKAKAYVQANLLKFLA